MAPGSAIVSVDAEVDTGSTALSGTSMACPHVSGAAALLLEENGNLDPSGVLDTLKSRAVQNLVIDLKPDDPNFFLWVSSEPAADLPPTPAPPPPPPPTPWPCPSYCEGE